MFDMILKDYCEDEGFQISEYSGRNFARDLMAIVLPNGLRTIAIFVQEFTLRLVEAEKELEGSEKEIANVELFERWDDFIKTLESDSMGRDEQVIYSRNFKWIDFQKATEEVG